MVAMIDGPVDESSLELRQNVRGSQIRVPACNAERSSKSHGIAAASALVADGYGVAPISSPYRIKC